MSGRNRSRMTVTICQYLACNLRVRGSVYILESPLRANARQVPRDSTKLLADRWGYLWRVVLQCHVPCLVPANRDAVWRVAASSCPSQSCMVEKWT